METHAQIQRITHEAEHVSRAGIVLTTIWTLLFAGLLAAVSVVVWNTRTQTLDEEVQPRAIRVPEGDVSNVRLDLFPRQGRGRGAGDGAGEALRLRQHRALREFDWTDATHERVRIPIEDAIELELRGEP